MNQAGKIDVLDFGFGQKILCEIKLECGNAIAYLQAFDQLQSLYFVSKFIAGSEDESFGCQH